MEGVLVLVEEVVVALVAVALVPVLADLLLEVSYQHQSAQQMELLTASGDLAQPSAYAVLCVCCAPLFTSSPTDG